MKFFADNIKGLEKTSMNKIEAKMRKVEAAGNKSLEAEIKTDTIVQIIQF